ncbi:MAG: class I SAM-dependent methyltransferase [Candidatus Hodarchaeota archaeon]
MLEQKADQNFWEKHWEMNNLIEKVKEGKENRLLKKFTCKFLKPKTNIIDGGCGIGQNVYGLRSWGYEAYGVDFTEKTVKKVKNEFPKLNISIQDVRELNFADNFFDGYWSVGVIEHFKRGYNEVLKEAKRVIKPGGYLFLSFPYFSPLRKLKAKLGNYKTCENKINEDNFYQFILNKEDVKLNAEMHGFKLIQQHPYNATKGIKDELPLLKSVLQKIYDSQNILMKSIRFLISMLFSIIAGHSILLIFRKK